MEPYAPPSRPAIKEKVPLQCLACGQAFMADKIALAGWRGTKFKITCRGLSNHLRSSKKNDLCRSFYTRNGISTSGDYSISAQHPSAPSLSQTANLTNGCPLTDTTCSGTDRNISSPVTLDLDDDSPFSNFDSSSNNLTQNALVLHGEKLSQLQPPQQPMAPHQKFTSRTSAIGKQACLPSVLLKCPPHQTLDALFFHQKLLPHIPSSALKYLNGIIPKSDAHHLTISAAIVTEEALLEPDDLLSSEDDDGSVPSSASSEHSIDSQPEQLVADGPIVDHRDAPSDHPILPRVEDCMVSKRRAFAIKQAGQSPPVPQLISELSLLNILTQHKAPMAMFSTIQKWAQESARLGHDHQRTCRTRSHVIQELEDRYDMTSSRFKPTVISYLPDERPTVVYISSFADAVYSLLSDPELTTEDNLSFPDPELPFPRVPNDRRLRTSVVSELHHGAWYKCTHQNVCTEPIDVLCPVIFYMDGVATDANGRLGLIPLSMTLGIYNIATRTRKEAWITIYYHPDDDSEASLHTKETLAIHKVMNLHRGLDAAFAEFRSITEAGGLKWDKLHYGGKDHKVNFKFVFTFIIGDTEMHDKLCGRYNCRGKNVKCLCRHCNCPLSESLNGRYPSTLFESAKLDRQLALNNLDYFQSISHHPIDNAFHKLDFGSNPYNIHLASPGELLHMHQKGMMMRYVEGLKNLILDKSTDSDKVHRRIRESLKRFDTLGLHYGGLMSRSSERDFPRTKFKTSLFSGTKKAAHEQAGVLLDLLLAMLSDRGRQILIHERTIKRCFLHDQIIMCDICLGLEEWMKKTSYSRNELKLVPCAMRYVITNVEATTKRGGMGTLLIKNHLYFHLHDYMTMWGPLRQMNSGPNESHHKTEVKAPSKNTQRRPASFIQQTSNRYTEIRLIRKGCQEVGLSDLQLQANKPPIDYNMNIAVTGARYSIGYFNHVPSMRWESKSHWNRTGIPRAVIELVCTEVLPLLPDSGSTGHAVPCFTEHKRLREDGRCIFRAHPCYRSTEDHPKDVWYDWAYFDVGDVRGTLPCQILSFLDLSLLPPNTRHNYRGFLISDPGQYAVVRKFKKQPSWIRADQDEEDPDAFCTWDTSLVQHGELEDGFFVLDCETITDLACVVPNIPILPWAETRKDTKKRDREERNLEAMVDPIGGYFVVKPKAKWGQWFTTEVIFSMEGEDVDDDDDDDDV